MNVLPDKDLQLLHAALSPGADANIREQARMLLTSVQEAPRLFFESETPDLSHLRSFDNETVVVVLQVKELKSLLVGGRDDKTKHLNFLNQAVEKSQNDLRLKIKEIQNKLDEHHEICKADICPLSIHHQLDVAYLDAIRREKRKEVKSNETND